MENFITYLNSYVGIINNIIWADAVLYTVLAVGVLFTIRTVFCQYHALTHGITVISGKYDKKDDPGAISHFQALSAALSATVGLGNIGGVAIAIALGGPGAIFWMWMIGLAGMALKTTSVTLSMLYRNVDDPENPHGGPMWVAKKAFAKSGRPWLGNIIGGIFCVTLIISAFTGGNMFQAWNVGDVTKEAFGLDKIWTGLILASIVAMVIIGGIKRIGGVAGFLVPFMCAIYVATAFLVVGLNLDQIPAMFRLIFSGAFSPTEAQGAFIGASVGYAFLWGMKRALFSSEAGQGSSPIAHSAAKTSEPVREAVVAGLEPFIDTIIVCTLTGLMLLSTGAWDRSGLYKGYEAEFNTRPSIQLVENENNELGWIVGEKHEFLKDGKLIVGGKTSLPSRLDENKKSLGAHWKNNDRLIVVASGGTTSKDTTSNRATLYGSAVIPEDKSVPYIHWEFVPLNGDDSYLIWSNLDKNNTPILINNGINKDYVGASLTSFAINLSLPGFGTWLILIASWLFAISTMISWSYYGEQGVIFLFGKSATLPYKILYCVLAVVASSDIVKTTKELGNLTDLGTGLMLWANIPIMLLFGGLAMKAYHEYINKVKSGKFNEQL